MPSIDRKPRRRLHSARVPDFAREREARAAAAEVAALPEGDGKDAALREIRPRLERWVMASWASPRRHDSEWLSRMAMLYVNRPTILPQLPPTGAA